MIDKMWPSGKANHSCENNMYTIRSTDKHKAFSQLPSYIVVNIILYYVPKLFDIKLFGL